MRELVVGTAGHIDHGKTSLVRALTGIDADRLDEEKRRGITIDIGFAHLQLAPDLRAGFVDVPGHERFVKNMLAGVGGIDMVLFVVAANESVKPQTREHFEICRLLGIRKGVVVLTKPDLVDSELLDLVRLEVEELVAGSFLADAPVVAVSSETGAGLDELKHLLRVAGRESVERDRSAAVRLPIDRSFSSRGFGTVLTGTLIAGALAIEQELQLYPTERRVRVRGLQVFGRSVPSAGAGQRTAVNVTGAEPSDVVRGMVASVAGRFLPVRTLDCSIELLRSAKPLKHRAPVHFHSGTAEIEAEIRLLAGQTAIAPGESVFARVVLREAALLLPGDRFIMRRFSPVFTIGGGTVIDISARRVRKPADPVARLRALRDAAPSERSALLVSETPEGLSLRRLSALTALPVSELRKPAPSSLYIASEDWLIARSAFECLRQRVLSATRQFHCDHPLLPGIPKASLLAPPHLLTELLRASPDVTVEGDIVRLRGHRVVLAEDEQRARSAIEAAFAQAGLSAPASNDVLVQSGVEPTRARTLLQILLREQKLIKISADLVFHKDALDGLRASLSPRKGERFSVGTFKDWTGVSRKYAIPLLEFLDREHVTRREGNDRVVL